MRVEKSRNLFLSSFLSLLVPGLGQLYNGELSKAVFFYLLQFVLILTPFAFGLQYTPNGLFIIFLIVIVFYLFCMGEATLRSLVKKKILLKPYNKWYLYIIILVIANIMSSSLNVLLKESLIGIKPYHLPSSSNEPSLYPGDNIIVDLGKKTPIQGTFIVFKFPRDPSIRYLKRVIATSHDVVEIKNKEVYVNGKILDEPYKVHRDDTIIPKNNSIRDNFGPVRIPDGKVFVMGDNRDYSADSRFFGPVDESAIIGTALYIYWSRDYQRIGMLVK